jgi:hypothetical protein
MVQAVLWDRFATAANRVFKESGVDVIIEPHAPC